MQPHTLLHIFRPVPALQESISRHCRISPLLAQLLINRGVKTPEDADKFLKSSLSHLHDPFSFTDMQKAVELVKYAAEKKQKVLVCSDYDVDGVTSLAVLKNSLKRRGIEALHFLPHRIHHGYGMHAEAVRLAKEKNVKLVITADCGISDTQHIEALRKEGVEVIVTDHHEPSAHHLPPASAIINPKVKGSKYAFRELAGVGVAFKLSQALTGAQLEEELDLVSLGTVADVVPLQGENRVLVKMGLRRMSKFSRLGLKALIEASGIKDKTISAQVISFILGPRLNASGRMDTPEAALKLLLCNEEAEARELARAMEAMNRQRQKVEGQIMEEANAMIEQEVNFKEHKVLVLAKEGWHQGVLGIVASKLADRFNRPTIIISLGEKSGKGSGRSIKNFHLFDALMECREFLGPFGGHSHAAGLVITGDQVAAFRDKLNKVASEKLRLEDLLPSIDVDLEVPLSLLTPEVVGEFELLEPFGTGNLKPLMLTKNLKVKGQPQELGRNTLKFWVTDGTDSKPVIGFGLGAMRNSLAAAEGLDLVYSPRIDSWQGESSVILEIEEMFLK